MVQSPLATASDGSPEQSIQADAIGVTVAEARKAEETASGNPLCTTGMLAFTAGALLLIVGGITTGALFAAGVIPFARGGSGETSRTVWDLTVAPSDARLRYAGRFAFSTDGSEAVSGWPGTRVALAVRGARRVSAVLANQRKGARYLATVDGVVADGSPFVIEPGFEGSVVIADGLNASSSASVVVELVKISEDAAQSGLEGAVAFLGFIVDDFGDAAGDDGKNATSTFVVDAAPAQPARRLHFVGDSDTVGYCADGGDSTERYSENNHVTWAAQLARALDAEHVATAISGIGVIDWPIGAKLERTNPFCVPDGGAVDDGGGDDDDDFSFSYGGDDDDDDGSDDDDAANLGYGGPSAACEAWDYTCADAPDAVFILLGPNDDLSDDGAVAPFVEAYTTLLKYFDGQYGECDAAARPRALVSVIGGSMNGFDPYDAIRAAIDDYNGDDTTTIPAAFVSMRRENWELANADGSSYLGCDAHYNEQGHRLLMDDILENVTSVLGWL